MDFLSTENICGQTLLRLVSRGSSINTELLRLSSHIPDVFHEKPSFENLKYSNLLSDFAYFSNADFYENKIETNPDLVDLDEELRDTVLTILERFFQLFESIYKYITDFNIYISEIIEGVFVQHTIEGLVMNTDARQLLAEAIHLYGVMLLMLDIKLPGPIREKLIVSYYRYKGGSSISHIDEISKLCANTHYGTTKKPKDYPVSFFARIPIDKDVVNMLIGKFRSEDLYYCTKAFPNPRHRSVALSNQASLLYILLFFSPEILIKENAIMRELVDKHFSDNWAISFYMGNIVDLEEAYINFKSAKLAMSNTLENNQIIELSQHHLYYLDECLKELKKLLVKGVLTQSYVLDHIPALLNVMRQSNVTLRWLLLHRLSSNRKIKEFLHVQLSVPTLLSLLLHLAHFEFVLKEMFHQLLTEKQTQWGISQKELKERMVELSDYFSGDKALTRVKKDENLQNWFKNLEKEISNINIDNTTSAGRKIVHIVQALQDVEEFHQIQNSLQIKQFLLESRDELKKMLRILNISQDVLSTLQIVSDFSYAWLLIREFIPLMHDIIKNDPTHVLLLRHTFLKLVSILDFPLTRITQCNSKDQDSVASFFSSELVGFVRSVLQIIPQSMFFTLHRIISLLSNKDLHIKMKIERNTLKEVSQLEARYHLSMDTHQVSVFGEGILAMETTLMGIIEVDPRKLLEDGIRKELVRLIATAMDEVLCFPDVKTKSIEFNNKLSLLAQKLDGLRLSFEYIQDYLNIYGLKMWQQEFSRIIYYNVEQECNQYLQKKIMDWQSVYQDEAIPIPNFSRRDHTNVNWTGRVVSAILILTSPTQMVYSDCLHGWVDPTNPSYPVVGIKTFDLLASSLEIFGLRGIDTVIAFRIVKLLKNFIVHLRRYLSDNLKTFLSELSKDLSPLGRFPHNSHSVYRLAVSKISKLLVVWTEMIATIGQCQLVRRLISRELKFRFHLNSKMLCSMLCNLNDTLLSDIRQHYLKPDEMPYPDENSPLLAEVNHYLESSGLSEVFNKIYMTCENIDNLPMLLFLYVISVFPKFSYHPTLTALISNSKEILDSTPLIIGLFTLLHQFPFNYTAEFISYLCQYVRSNIIESETSNDLSQECRNILIFLEDFCKFSHLPRSIITNSIPSYIFDRFTH